MTVDAPYLRIVPQDIVEVVLERKSNAGSKHARRSPRSKRLLSGLLRCGACGGMPILGSDRSGSRIQCSTYKENGSCKNGAHYYIEKLEHAVVHALRSQLTNPTLIADYIETYTEERRSKQQREASRGMLRATSTLALPNTASKPRRKPSQSRKESDGDCPAYSVEADAACAIAWTCCLAVFFSRARSPAASMRSSNCEPVTVTPLGAMIQVARSAPQHQRNRGRCG